MAATIINRTASWYRPYRLDGRKVRDVLFYRKGEVVIRTGRGWIERHGDVYVSEKDVTQIRLAAPLRRAMKVNLTRGGHFYVSARGLAGEKEWDLYLDLDAGDFEISEEEVVPFYSDSQGTTYCKVRKLTGTFETGKRETISIMVPDSLLRQNNLYGQKMAEIVARLAAIHGGSNRSVSPEDFVKNPELLQLLNEAAALYAASKEDA